LIAGTFLPGMAGAASLDAASSADAALATLFGVALVGCEIDAFPAQPEESITPKTSGELAPQYLFKSLMLATNVAYRHGRSVFL
jgi:hypothetical protein